MFLLQAITGLQHVQVVSLIAKTGKDKRKEKAYLIMNTIPLDQTSIRPDGRKRVPWLGRRIGKLLRKRSSSNRVKKRPSLFRRMKSGTKSMDTGSYSSSSGTPSPRRSESMKDRLQRSLKKGTSSSTKRKQAPVSPLARSTSPIALTTMITPTCSPPGSTQNLNQQATPPNSPPIITTRPERHSMFVESNLLSTRKSMSISELFPKRTSPHTSPLLKRAVSPSPETHMKVSSRARRSSTLERSSNIKIKKKTSGSVSYL